MRIDSPVTEIRGVGEKTGERLEKLGIRTVGELLSFFPRDYVRYPRAVSAKEAAAAMGVGGIPPAEDAGGILEAMDATQGGADADDGIDAPPDASGISKAPDENGARADAGGIPDAVPAASGMTAIIERVRTAPAVRYTRRMPITQLYIGEGGAKISLVWFYMPYLRSRLSPGSEFVFYGRLQKRNGRLVMDQPAIYEPGRYGQMEGAILPVYALTKGITNRQVEKAVRAALSEESILAEHMPEEILERHGLCGYERAVRQMHFPDGMDALSDARRRLVFDEFFLFVLRMQYQKKRRIRAGNEFFFPDDGFLESLIPRLPFSLTAAQERVLSDIRRDMRGESVMERLVQGDVGSGKTVVAFLAMAEAAHAGYQSAIMAPTDVLARQHAATFDKLSRDLGISFPVVLLTGSMTARQKRLAREAMALYPNAIIVGTQALIQEGAFFDNLALVITDEQHRFGVRQREALAKKGASPHVLVMSATPIPRTLALILYGDFDISVIDEAPASRLPVKTCAVGPEFRPKAYSFLEREVRSGRQAYVICPLVEPEEGMALESATEYVKKLRGILPEDFRLGVLHGQMKPEQKGRVMEAFSSGEVQILVATTVVEVGIDVPNATVMMVENAERFGLAQLHQLRGRVGRGDAQSYCILINATGSESAGERLDVLCHSRDGFKIADEDLRLRGPGDFFGIRQSGGMEFAVADVYQDASVLLEARDEAERLLEEDGELIGEGHAALRAIVLSDEAERAGI